ncbi:NAD(P)-dependent dehydrogenase (short-subunit alcohol dehydrogenase family) [Rhodoligotrophos appendicifer]|uniref:SDR family NAD(P)-dependent oxidoreductase n=1 Tax=Rhodoligotrophos appendicifer TaxID=987056 RepID=UPI001184B357|nr:SDR family NAD(P)-dependent oxidoreductase [Rhodoligotrophos appendicifer]
MGGSRDVDPLRFLEGKTAWVTGGANGPGRIAAIALAKAGADIAIGTLLDLHHHWTPADLRRASTDDLDNVLDAIAITGSRGIGGHLDIRSEESVERFRSHVNGEVGPADILVNAARVSFPPQRPDHRVDEWQLVLDEYLNGTLRMIRSCIPVMSERRWGRIIGIPSLVNESVVDEAAVRSLQGGLQSLTRGIAVEATPLGIGCFTISLDQSTPDTLGELVASLCQASAMPLSGEEVTLSAA